MKLLKNFLKTTRSRLKRRSSYVLIFLNGFLLASLAYFYMEDNYEQKVFDSLVEHIKVTAAKQANADKTDGLIRTSLSLTNFLGQGRMKIFEGHELNSIKSELIHPVSFDLMTGKGACGSYSYILSRLLSELKIPNRIAQMKVGDEYGGHNIVEAKSSKGWVVLDPLFNLYFTRPDGQMASFADVQKDWAYFKDQAPQGYDEKYSYTGVRYTNWTKIPVVMPVVKKVLQWTIGKEETETFSIRTHMLKKFTILLNITFLLYVLVLIATVKKLINRKRKTRAFNAELLFINSGVSRVAAVQ